MKKIFVPVFLVVLILSACNSSKLSFSEIDIVPEKFEEYIDSDLNLQLIDDGTKGSYIIFHSRGDIEADLDTQDNIVTVIFNEVNSQADVLKRNVYYLTTDSKHDTIKVLVNGEEVPFDERISL